MRIKALLPLILSASVIGHAAFGQAPELGSDALLKAGTLQMAADFAAAPNQFTTPDGKKDGLDVDICGGVAAKLGLSLDWTNLAFPGLVPGLQAQRFDALCTAIFITPERKQIMNMVAYVQWGEGLMVPKGSPLGKGCSFKSGDNTTYDGCFDSLAGKAVSVGTAGTTNKNLQKESDRLVAKGLAPITIRGFDSVAEGIQALVSGQVDATYQNDPQNAFYIARNNAPLEIAFTGYNPNRLALATLKANTKLADALQWALQQMKADGSYDKIVAKWGVAGVPEFTMNP
jgi:polar amino acid transport system substrate-binding protein